MNKPSLPLYAYAMMGAAAVLAIVLSLPYHGVGELLFKLLQWSLIVALAAALLSVYLIPWRVAVRREHVNAPAILVLTLLLGWTFIGWAVALIWAMTAQNQQARS